MGQTQHMVQGALGPQGGLEGKEQKVYSARRRKTRILKSRSVPCFGYVLMSLGLLCWKRLGGGWEEAGEQFRGGEQ